jgi:hypothetical protein
MMTDDRGWLGSPLAAMPCHLPTTRSGFHQPLQIHENGQPLASVKRATHRLCSGDVSGTIALRLDADDVRHYEIRMALNGETFYEQVFAEQGGVEREAADALRGFARGACKTKGVNHDGLEHANPSAGRV